MKNVKLALATTLTTITMTLAGNALAGDAAMHMDFYLEDKVTESAIVVENTSILRAEPIQAGMITSTVERQPVIIDYATTKPAPQRVFQQRIYSVRAGDTLLKISRKTGVALLELARLNQIKYEDLNHIKVGQQLKLI